MRPPTHLAAARRLHDYLAARHGRDGALVGPDCGIRFNYRAGRFIKSYLSFVPWRDDYYYVQCQAYWVLANWRLLDLTADDRYRVEATEASRRMIAAQRPDGSWDYPNPAWKGRIATAEGTWGALGLLETYRRTGQENCLHAVRRWKDFLDQHVGFIEHDGAQAVNYFAHRDADLVPNNSAFMLRFLAEMSLAEKDDRFLERCRGLVEFLRRVQRPAGELPYSVPASGDTGGRAHFQCFQYNAFQLLDLLRYHDVTGDPQAEGTIQRLVGFVATGLDEAGAARYDCQKGSPRRVIYHTAAVGAALCEASRHNLGEHRQVAGKGFDWVLAHQRPDGGFPFSRRDYGVLRDDRSYPRNQAMILLHLLLSEGA